MAASAASVSSSSGETVSSLDSELTTETVTSSKFPGLSVACSPRTGHDGEKWDAARRLKEAEDALSSGKTEIAFCRVTSLPARMDTIAPEVKNIILAGIHKKLDLSGVTLPPKLKCIHLFISNGGIIWPRQFPSDLRAMWFWGCRCDDILPPAFPETLTNIDISRCSFRRLPPLPQTLKRITMNECPLEECPELPEHEEWEIAKFERNGFTRMPNSFFRAFRGSRRLMYVAAVDSFDQEWYDSLGDEKKIHITRLTGGKTKAARA